MLSGKFDVVVACAVFTCIPSLDARVEVAAEITRVLKPGGVVHVSEFSSDETEVFMSSLGLPMRYSSLRELRELFVGFARIHNETASTSTMSGETASRYRAFFRKPLNDAVHAKSA